MGYSVLTVAATDLEGNENISYRILSSSREFSIDPMNGELFIVALLFIGFSYRMETWNNPFQVLLKQPSTPAPWMIDITFLFLFLSNAIVANPTVVSLLQHLGGWKAKGID